MRLWRLFLTLWLSLHLAACSQAVPPGIITPSLSAETSEVVHPTVYNSPSSTPIENTTIQRPEITPTSPPLIPSPQPASINPQTIEQITLANELSLGSNLLILDLAWLNHKSTLLVAASDQLILYTIPGLIEINRFDAGGWINDLAVHPTESHLAGALQDGSVLIWEFENLKEPLVIKAHKKGANSVVFSPDGKLLGSGGNDGMARLWNPELGSLGSEMIGGAFAIPAVLFTPDGAGLAVASGSIIRVRDISTGRFTQTFRSQNGITALALSPDGTLLAAGSVNGELNAWELQTADLAWSVSLQKENITRANMIWSLSFSPDGALLAAAENDGTVTLVDAISGDVLLRLPAHRQAATSVVFSPDGVWLAAGGFDRRLTLWNVGK